MELFYVTVLGAVIGATLRYLLPGRGSYGFALLPAVGAASTAVIWEALTWMGLKYDGGWIWAIAIVGGALGVDRRGPADRAPASRSRRPPAPTQRRSRLTVG